MNDDGRGRRGLERPGGRDLGDAELVAHVRAELVVRHELLGDQAGEPGLDAAVLVDLGELVQLGPAVLGERLGLDLAGRPPRRRAASSPRCTRRRAIDIAPRDEPGDARR